MRVRRAGVLGASLGALALFAACGSSAKPLSKADFITKADAVCQKYNGLVVQSTKDLKHPTTAQIVDATKTRIVPLLKRQDNELKKLKPPEADRTAVDKIRSDLRAVTADIDHNTQAFVQAHGVTTLATATSGEAKAYGLKVCAKAGS